MKRITVLVLSLIILLLTGCASAQPVSASEVYTAASVAETETASSDKEKYICVSCQSNYEYFTDHRLGFVKACEDLGVDYEYLAPTENNIDIMKEYVEYAIVIGAKGIVLFGASDELRDVINKAWKAGIPTVTIDGDVKDSDRIAFVGTDNTKAGKTSGELAIEKLKSEGKLYGANIVILTDSNIELHRERAAAVKAELDEYPSVKYITAETNANTNDAYTNMMDVFRNNEKVDMVICTDYHGGPGAAAAAEELGIIDDVDIIAMDKSSYVLEKIKEGSITATIAQQTALMPYYAMHILYDYNNSEMTVGSDRNATGLFGVPTYIDTGLYIIDKSNVNSFIRN